MSYILDKLLNKTNVLNIGHYNKVLLCLERYKNDCAMQGDGIKILEMGCSDSTAITQFCLDSGLLLILDNAISNYSEDITLQSSVNNISNLLEVADDLKRVMPDAFKNDLDVLIKKDGGVQPRK